MAKEIKYGAEARSALEAGVDKLADTVKCSPILAQPTIRLLPML